jgi:hypothetical protein
METASTALVDQYLQHLSGEDLELLVGSRSSTTDHDRRRELRSRPGAFSERLESPEVFAAVFGVGVGGGGELAQAPEIAGVCSPFLVFAVAVERAASELSTATFVVERLAPRMRGPVFDVERLRDFLADPWRRLFLVELLASYTHVASGSVIVSTRRGWRRQRFSELDPVQMAGLLEVVTPAERPGVYRRLGDLALFLTGVFPDAVARRGFGPLDEGRLLRAGRLVQGSSSADGPAAGAGSRPVPGLGDDGAVALLELLGRRWYGAAAEAAPTPVPTNLRVLGELPERFAQARRILNLVTDRFLFERRSTWFGFS